MSETKKPAPRKTKPKAIMYASVKLSMYHPYQNIRFEPMVPTACEKDSWLASQIEVGLIKEV